jgi:PAS domain S-box-containing protein/putative nucleotidyltransferase with HDIG domain
VGYFSRAIEGTMKTMGLKEMKIKKDKFSMLIENIQDGYAYHEIVRDSSGKPVDFIFIDVNPAFETITGLNRIDILGKTFTEVLPEIKEPGLDWINIYKQSTHTEKPIQLESFSEALNRWYEISAFIPEEGYFAVVFRDVTEKKMATQMLVTSETRYRRLFESTKDGILILNAESGKIIDANPFLLQRVGFSKEEILGKPIWEIEKFKDIVANQDRFLELKQKEYIRTEDLPLQTVEGQQVTVEFVSNIYLEGQNKVIQCNLRDITERRKMEKALLESERKLSSILNNIPDVIWSLSLPDMDLSYVSPSVSKMYGRPAEEFVKHPSLWQDAVHPDDQYQTELTFKQLYKEGSAERECRIVRPDESVIWINDKSKIIYDENQVPLRIEGIASDITDRKLAEESVINRLAELEAIYKVSAILRTAETQDDMLKLFLVETLAVVNTEAGAICINNPTNEQSRFTATHGWFSELDNVFLKNEDNLVTKACASKKAKFSAECAKDFRMKYPEIIPEGWSITCLPLLADADTMGTIFVSFELPREITAEELKLLTSLTEMAGTAIQRISHNENNIRHLEQLQALRNIDMAISSSKDLRVIYKVILNEITSLLNVNAAALIRLDPNSGVLKYEAWQGFHTKNLEKIELFIGKGFAGQVAMEGKSVCIENLNDTGTDTTQNLLLEKENAHSYCAVPLINKGRVEGVLEIFHRNPFSISEEWLKFLETLAWQATMAIDSAELVHNLAKTNYKLIQAYDSTIKGWAFALDLRDKETEEHSLRVTEMTVNIAREMGMSQEELVHVRRGALLHDIGKMGVSDTILLKPGELTKEEWVIMRQHPTFAFEMLSTIEYLRPALDIPYCHHEKWDGTGYPRGLRHEEIPLVARIFSVADVYDALTSDRPYRKAWSKEEAVEHIRQERGSHFDPQVVEMFLREVK